MPSKTDLSAYKKPTTPPILKTAQEKAKAKSEKGKRGRKAKPENEKLSVVVQVKLTESQAKKLNEKRGLTPAGTFLRNKLEIDTDLFS